MTPSTVPVAVEKTLHRVVSDESGARVPLRLRLFNLVGVTGPLIGLIVAIVLLWGWGFSWLHLGLLLGTYVFTALGITVGYHRLFTHRAFETSKPVKVFFAILGSMAIEGPLLRWVATHRRHHQHSDDELDPHSPHGHGDTFWGMVKGMWHAHVGWIFQPDAPGLSKYVQDLIADNALRRVSLLFPLWAILSLLIPTVLGGVLTLTWTGALLGFLWGGLVRVFLVHHVTWSINSVCHIWGTRPFQSGDHSRNNAIFGILGFGEGWHNNHHAFPTSARHGLRWWQVDFSYYVICGMELVGLARRVRVPAPQHIDAKRRK